MYKVIRALQGVLLVVAESVKSKEKSVTILLLDLTQACLTRRASRIRSRSKEGPTLASAHISHMFCHDDDVPFLERREEGQAHSTTCSAQGLRAHRQTGDIIRDEG